MENQVFRFENEICGVIGILKMPKEMRVLMSAAFFQNFDWAKLTIQTGNQYSLLEGESNLYFEDGFVGRSILNVAALQDTLQTSLGRDRSIVMNREKVDQFSKKRTIGSNITESRGYEITLKNNKSQAVTLVVKDQIPVSINSNIVVTPGELSRGNLDTQTGIVTLEITLAPGAQQKLVLQYEVKYPKSERLILD
ncbi:DUF4139 domain-containing protein [Algoriphagus alkaliphilus]|nr:DUF4139 domain-containing protein [Algoriphagus alkaliphilus]MBA4300967.1 DUF4139 domain-containing protein [Cyclobacterium sp.]